MPISIGVVLVVGLKVKLPKPCIVAFVVEAKNKLSALKSMLPTWVEEPITVLFEPMLC